MQVVPFNKKELVCRSFTFFYQSCCASSLSLRKPKMFSILPLAKDFPRLHHYLFEHFVDTYKNIYLFPFFLINIMTNKYTYKTSKALKHKSIYSIVKR